MRHIILAIALLIAAAVSAASQTVAITNAKVYPISGPPISNGTVLIRDGVIAAVGANVTIPSGAQRIDATGKIVTPGFINSLTDLGVVEVGQVRSTNDVSARGSNNIAASFRVWEGLNPESVLFGPTRNEGVTSVVIVPRGGLISGQAAAIDLVSGHANDMMRKPAVAMIGQIG